MPCVNCQLLCEHAVFYKGLVLDIQQKRCTSREHRQILPFLSSSMMNYYYNIVCRSAISIPARAA